MKDTNETHSAHVVVSESQHFEATSDDSIYVTLRDNYHLRLDALTDFCCADTSPLGADLAVVLAAVRDADKRVKRFHSLSWQRNIRLDVPVYELQKWRQSDVQAAMRDCLQYLTGDSWDVRFSKRKRKFSGAIQRPLGIQPREDVAFMPFSHGLDSYAQLVLLSHRDKSRKVIPVNYTPRPGVPTTTVHRKAGSLSTVGVTGATQAPSHPEQSGRTRPFVYDTLAAYAACLHGDCGEVIIPENGQGSLGASLVRLGAEAPHRSCHPGFTVRLANFINNLLGKEITFIHSALYLTKGQVLAELSRIKPNTSEWLTGYKSCSYDRRNTSKDHKAIHCGFCGNCLLRRVSVLAAGIEEDATPYLVTRLDAETFEEALAGSGRERNFKSFRDVAHNAARSMQRLADVATGSQKIHFAAEVEGLAHYQGLSTREVEEQLRNLVTCHREEWENFVARVGQSSWLTEFARI